jgi:antirestriction protein ArdC
MENVIVRTFIHAAAAEQARTELLAAGIPADGVEVSVRMDETGAVQGNFTVGDAPEIKGKTAYTHTYAPVAQDDVRDCQITVTADDAAQAQRAAEILDRLGALDPDPAHRAAQQNVSRH